MWGRGWVEWTETIFDSMIPCYVRAAKLKKFQKINRPLLQ